MKCQYCGRNEVKSYDLCDTCAEHLYKEQQTEDMNELLNDETYIKDMLRSSTYQWDFDYQSGTYVEYSIGYNGEKKYTGNTFGD